MERGHHPYSMARILTLLRMSRSLGAYTIVPRLVLLTLLLLLL
jgi:hypothetical protein